MVQSDNLQNSRLFFGTYEPELYTVPISAVRNSTVSDLDPYVRRISGRRASGSEGITSDNAGQLYYSMQDQGVVVRWNMSEANLRSGRRKVVQSQTEFQWINSISVSEGYIWIVTNK